MGDWTPSAEWFESLLAHAVTDDDRSRPYPFFLASPLEADVTTLGDPSEWLIEWKWDGIRAQLVKRAASVHLWSRGEELITHRFPEIAAAATRLPDGTVLDGEVLAFRDERPMPFSALQQRIGRQKQVAQLVRAVPVVFMTYDILEEHGAGIRTIPQGERSLPGWRRYSPAAAGGASTRGRHANLADGAGADVGGTGGDASRRAHQGRRRPDAEAARRRHTASVGAGAIGGSGRSIRSRSTPF